MLVDSHCHLDAAEFGDAASQLAQQAADNDVRWIVVPAVEAANFSSVANLAASLPNCVYALGIHPLYVPQAAPEDLNRLREAVKLAMADERFVGIGEIGLDFFVPELTTDAMREKQTHFYVEQLKIAREFDLPVILHVRRSQDMLLKHLRRIPVVGGIAHAFNGSEQQAQAFISLGFALGFGGAMTFTRDLELLDIEMRLLLAHRIRGQLRHKKIQTDFTDTNKALVGHGQLYGLTQSIQILRCRLRHIERVNT